jgi:hypothetical protein
VAVSVAEEQESSHVPQNLGAYKVVACRRKFKSRSNFFAIAYSQPRHGGNVEEYRLKWAQVVQDGDKGRQNTKKEEINALKSTTFLPRFRPKDFKHED